MHYSLEISIKIREVIESGFDAYVEHGPIGFLEQDAGAADAPFVKVGYETLTGHSAEKAGEGWDAHT